MQAIPSPGYSDPLVGQVLPGGLRVLERLGGSSEDPLYRAQYGQTGPPVAVQVLGVSKNRRDPSGITPSATRLWQQLRRACEIRHPNVASLLELGTTPDGMVYVVGELLTGQLLSEVLLARGTLPLAQAVHICLQAAAGLQAAHLVGVAHGRLSPRTILITWAEDERPLVKLVRFDFSWYEAESVQSPDPGEDDPYSSPERRAGCAPDEVSDVFSLGAVLHHLLLGTPPAEDLAPGFIPPALRRVLERALASPGQRYPTVAAFAEALAQAVGSPVKQERAAWRSGWLAASIVALIVAASLWLGWDRLHANLNSVTVSPQRPLSPDTGATAPEQPKQPSVSERSVQPAHNRTGGSEPVEIGAISKSKVDDSAAKVSSQTAARPDSARGPYISPFRRAHPWAAHPIGGTYFPSSCPLALASSELIYFKTEQEARATGRSRSTAPGCS